MSFPSSSANSNNNNEILLDLHEDDRANEAKIKSLSDSISMAYKEPNAEPKKEVNTQYDGILSMNSPQPNYNPNPFGMNGMMGGMNGYNQYNNQFGMGNYGMNMNMNMGYYYPRPYIGIELYNDPNKKNQTQESQPKANVTYNANFYNSDKKKTEPADPFTNLVSFK